MRSFERNITAPARQLQAGCWDGYGQTGPAYAWKGGPQMASVAKMLRAIGGEAWWRRNTAAASAGNASEPGHRPRWRAA